MGTEKRERQKANRAQKQQQIQQEATRRKMFRRIALGVGAVAAVFLVAWIASNFVADDEPTPPPATVSEPIVLEPADSVVQAPVDTTSDTPVTTPADSPATTEG